MNNLSGMKFKNFTVLKFSHRVKRNYFWICKCDCGKEKVIQYSSLKYRKTSKCNCEINHNFKHGLSKSRIWRIWDHILTRCKNPKSDHFKYYGGRGIKVCPEWHDSVTFIKWAKSNGYRDNLTIDRINNNGNYEPSNCRWVTIDENNKNR